MDVDVNEFGTQVRSCYAMPCRAVDVDVKSMGKLFITSKFEENTPLNA